MRAVRDAGRGAALHRRERAGRDREAVHRSSAVGAAAAGHDPAGDRWSRVQSAGEGAGGPVCDRGPVRRGPDALGCADGSAATLGSPPPRAGRRHGCRRGAGIHRGAVAWGRRPRAGPEPRRGRAVRRARPEARLVA
ncbi:MAG: hypothetical protein E6J77_04220 [Deltaproteobacteria bacterium]|nr:MAG: hypothetical protein E6J77_04220 [Deltaproteobacteria bacterium]